MPDLPPNLSLVEKAEWVHQHGQLVNTEDYYSFFVVVYQLGQNNIELVYDFSGSLLDVEYTSDSTTEPSDEEITDVN